MTDDTDHPGTDHQEKIDHDEPYLNEREETAVAEHRSLSALSVYTVVHSEGIEELERPSKSLWWSGVAAGLSISTSVLAEGVLHKIFIDHPYREAIENLGYTVGFVLVILGRLQLFTENTISVILPLLRHPTAAMAKCILRLWTIVLVANLVGTFLTAAITYWLGTAPQEYIDGMIEISKHFGHLDAGSAFARGIPAGFLIAAVVWMLPSSKGFEIFTIVLFTYIIALGGFTHVIAGSTELSLLVVAGETGVLHALALTVATLAGNIIGGTGLFALLAYGQVANELDEREDRGDLRRFTPRS